MSPITRDEASDWGRVAFEMGLTLQRAKDDIRECGCPERLLSEVESSYEGARRNAIHQEG